MNRLEPSLHLTTNTYSPKSIQHAFQFSYFIFERSILYSLAKLLIITIFKGLKSNSKWVKLLLWSIGESGENFIYIHLTLKLE